jgi:hypothetical protein
MNVDTMLELSSEAARIAALKNALKSIGDMDLSSDSWFDDRFMYNYGPEDEKSNDEGWMDDLDEAA